MKLEDRQLEVEGDLLLGDTTKFSFDEDSLEGLMDLLSDNYSDIILAILRELATNARDSHVEAGNPDPIEIILPTDVEPELIIRDRGTGLDPSNAVRTFTKYGYSTKRESDDYTGMLGIGSKSPIAYCEAFTVIARKDGVETTLLVSRDNHDVGELSDLVAATDEPNGVEIRIPVMPEDILRFEAKARWLFKFWKFPVTINGERLDNSKIEGFTRINDELAICNSSNSYSYDSYVVMGGVPYRVPSDHAQIVLDRFSQYSVNTNKRYARYASSDGFKFILWVPIGTVLFSPDRENLKITKERTTEALSAFKDWIDDYGARMVYEYAQEIAKEDVITSYENGFVRAVNPYWHNLRVPRTNTFLDQFDQHRNVSFDRKSTATVDAYFTTMKAPRVHIGNFFTRSLFTEKRPVTVLVTGYKPTNVSTNYVYRITKALEADQDLDFSSINGEMWLFANGPSRSPFFEFDHVIHWERVKELTTSLGHIRRKRVPQRPIDKMKDTRSFYTKSEKYRGQPISKLDKYAPIIYYHPSDDWSHRIRDNIWEMVPDAQILEVYKKDLKHFRDMQPESLHYNAVYEYFMAEVAFGMSFEEIFVILGGRDWVSRTFRDRGWYSKPRKRHLSGIKDVDLRRALQYMLDVREEVIAPSSKVSKFMFVMQQAGYSRPRILREIKKDNPDAYARAKSLVARIKHDYPLLSVIEAEQTGRLIEYVNAMHNYRRS